MSPLARFYVLLSMVALLVLGSPGCGSCVPVGGLGPLPVRARKDVSGAAFLDEEGRRVSIADFKGRVVLIDVWATWCPPCRRSLPEVAALQKSGDEACAVLAVSVDKGGWAVVKPFLSQNAQLGLRALVPEDRRSMEPFGSIGGIPTTILVDRQGRMRERWLGYFPGRAGQALKAALQER